MTLRSCLPTFPCSEPLVISAFAFGRYRPSIFRITNSRLMRARILSVDEADVSSHSTSEIVLWMFIVSVRQDLLQEA